MWIFEDSMNSISLMTDIVGFAFRFETLFLVLNVPHTLRPVQKIVLRTGMKMFSFETRTDNAVVTETQTHPSLLQIL